MENIKLKLTLNAELNPIWLLLALLEAHHILHVSRVRVKLNYTPRFRSYRTVNAVQSLNATQ